MEPPEEEVSQGRTHVEREIGLHAPIVRDERGHKMCIRASDTALKEFQ